jgi:hypothetical protein
VVSSDGDSSDAVEAYGGGAVPLTPAGALSEPDGLSSLLLDSEFTLDAEPGQACGGGFVPVDALRSDGSPASQRRQAAGREYPTCSLPGIIMPSKAWHPTMGAKSIIVPVPECEANAVVRYFHRQPWRHLIVSASCRARAVWFSELNLLLPRPEQGRKYSKQPFKRCFPRIGGVTVDLYRLYQDVCRSGGLVSLTRKRAMARLARQLGVRPSFKGAGHYLRQIYLRLLYDIERSELRTPSLRARACGSGDGCPCGAAGGRASWWGEGDAVSRKCAQACIAPGELANPHRRSASSSTHCILGQSGGRDLSVTEAHETQHARSQLALSALAWCIGGSMCARCQLRRASIGVVRVDLDCKSWGSKLCRVCAGYLRSLLEGGRVWSPEVVTWIAAPAAGLHPVRPPAASSCSSPLGGIAGRPACWGRRAVNQALHAAYAKEREAAARRAALLPEHVLAKALPKRPSARASCKQWRQVRATWLGSKLLYLSGRCRVCSRQVMRSKPGPGSLRHCPPAPVMPAAAAAAAPGTPPEDSVGLKQSDVCSRHAWASVSPPTGGTRTAAATRATVGQGLRRVRFCGWCERQQESFGLVLGRGAGRAASGRAWVAKGCGACLSAAAGWVAPPLLALPSCYCSPLLVSAMYFGCSLTVAWTSGSNMHDWRRIMAAGLPRRPMPRRAPAT